MKKKKFVKKLVLRRETIEHLNIDEMLNSLAAGLAEPSNAPLETCETRAPDPCHSDLCAGLRTIIIRG